MKAIIKKTRGGDKKIISIGEEYDGMTIMVDDIEVECYDRRGNLKRLPLDYLESYYNQ